MHSSSTRRKLLAGLAGLAASGSALAKLATTPAQMAGPFYPLEFPLDDDNDLTRVKGRAGVARGQHTDLSGRVLNADGRPIQNARVEIWQCDANGRYHHPHDSGPAPDPNFQGFGHALTDTLGRYRFRTIRPVPYPGRTPHIHMAVHLPEEKPFVTQLYVADEPLNLRDFIYMSLSPELRQRASADFMRVKSGETVFAARFDIVLADTHGTPRL